MEKARTEAEEAQRILLAALNGLAGLMILDSDRPQAVALYRQAGGLPVTAFSSLIPLHQSPPPLQSMSVRIWSGWEYGQQKDWEPTI